MRNIKTVLLFCFCLVLLLAHPVLAQGVLRMSTTTSLDNSGLYAVLNPPFEKKYNCRVDILSMGTGKALKVAENGDVDIVFVHAKESEEKFVAAGFGLQRHEVAWNDFIIIGSMSDPAHIKGLHDAKAAFARIAEGGFSFISRGDDSGTHKKEKALWKKTGLTPSGQWYIEAGLGMGEVIMMATEKQAYTLTDRGTYLAFKSKTDLTLLCEKDPDLKNIYSVIAVNPARYPQVNHKLAAEYIKWVSSPDGQKIIGQFGKEKFGIPLFNPISSK